jgi:3-oxoacyl-[acyl-carrier protein] reductase
MPVAVITGVSRGIGRACAHAFADRGFDLALLGRVSDAHETTRRDCAGRDVRAVSYECDMADADAIAEAAKAVLADFGAPRVLINTAGVLRRGPKLHELDVEDWDQLMAVNLRGPFLLSRALLPAMLDAKRGRILFVSSVSGTIACPQMAHYGSSKWGLIGLSQALAEELRGTGVQALAVLPGSVDTAMLELTPFEPDMSAEDVAKVIVYNALDAPDAVSGSSVQIFG